MTEDTDIDIGALREEWHENKHRPAWVQRHRDQLQAATDLPIPLSIGAIDDWLGGYASHVSRRLNTVDGDGTDTEPTNTEATVTDSITDDGGTA